MNVLKTIFDKCLTRKTQNCKIFNKVDELVKAIYIYIYSSMHVYVILTVLKYILAKYKSVIMWFKTAFELNSKHVIANM